MSSEQKRTCLVGWSSQSSAPEILEVVKKNRKSTMGWAWALLVVFPLGFLLAGLCVDEIPLKEAFIIGTILGVAMFGINLVRIKNVKKPMWEGVVTAKLQKERREHNRGDDSFRNYTEFTVVIKTEAGRTKRLVERDSRKEMYDYLAVGDRVRYYPAFDSFEKYDKSKDSIIYCNVCRMINSIESERCKNCSNLLFK